MKPVIPVLLILIAIAAAAGLAWIYLSGSLSRGPVDHAAQHSLPPFKRIVIDGLTEVTLVQGSAESIAVETTSRQASRVVADVTDGTLTIANSGAHRRWFDFFSGGSRPLRTTVTFRELESVAASGAVKLTAGPFKA